MSLGQFSAHPSNPLEVRSSDALNRAFKAQMDDGTLISTITSDDPMDMLTYQAQVADVVPGYAEQKEIQAQKYVNLDSEESDDLQAFDQDDTPRKMVTLKDYDEEMGSEDDEEGDDEEEVVEQRGDVTRIFDDDEDEDGQGLGVEYEDEDEEMQQEEDWEEYEEDLNDGFQPTSEDFDCFALDEDEEEHSIKRKPEDEQAEIMQEMQDFKRSLPQLEGNYKLIDRLGTGTFSSVYKAIDLKYDEYDNTPWQGHHPPESSAHWQSVSKPAGSRVFVAIKRIYVTSGPERIRNELQLMEACRGCRHVSQLITAFRHEDQVAIVMPYQRNDDFREYFTELPMPAIKEYFRCLLRALRDVNRRNIIHRDVKPANFLFDPRTGQGSLCDFGLAQRFDNKAPTYGACMHTTMSNEYPHGKYIRKSEYDAEFVKKQQQEARMKSKARPENVGYPDKDLRVPMKANRAGTRGFRAPEVLFKCGQQNGAVDVWSAGIILLFFLTKKFPLFQANDDVEALMEIAAILGKTKMEKIATLHGRTFSTNVPQAQAEETTWRTFVEKLNPDLHTMPPPNPKFYPYTLPSQKAKLVLEAEAVNSLTESKDEPKIERSPPKPKPRWKPRAPPYSRAERWKQMQLEDKLKKEEKERLAKLALATPKPDPPPPLTIDLRNGNPLLGDDPGSPLTPISSPSLSAAGGDEGVDDAIVLDAPEAEVQPEPEPVPEPKPDPGPSAEEVYKRDVENALDLLEKLLHPESVWRITPRAALYHPFLAERMPQPASSSNDPGSAGEEPKPPPRKADDDYVPNPFGEGVCKALHFVDPVTEAPGVILRECVCGCGREGCEGSVEKVRMLVDAGEGLTIGNRPCEFHTGYVFP